MNASIRCQILHADGVIEEFPVVAADEVKEAFLTLDWASEFETISALEKVHEGNPCHPYFTIFAPKGFLSLTPQPEGGFTATYPLYENAKRFGFLPVRIRTRKKIGDLTVETAGNLIGPFLSGDFASVDSMASEEGLVT